MSEGLKAITPVTMDEIITGTTSAQRNAMLIKICEENNIDAGIFKNFRILEKGDLLKDINVIVDEMRPSIEKRLDSLYARTDVKFFGDRIIRHTSMNLFEVILLPHVLGQRDVVFNTLLKGMEEVGGVDDALLDEIVLGEIPTPSGGTTFYVIDGQRRLVRIGIEYRKRYGIENMNAVMSTKEIAVRIIPLKDHREAITLFVQLQKYKEKISAIDQQITEGIIGEPLSLYTWRWLMYHDIATRRLETSNTSSFFLESTKARSLLGASLNGHHEDVELLSADKDFSLVECCNRAINAIKRYYPKGIRIEVQGFSVLAAFYYLYGEVLDARKDVSQVVEEHFYNRTKSQGKDAFSREHSNHWEESGLRDRVNEINQILKERKIIPRGTRTYNYPLDVEKIDMDNTILHNLLKRKYN
jgi:hypothetical protein